MPAVGIVPRRLSRGHRMIVHRRAHVGAVTLVSAHDGRSGLHRHLGVVVVGVVSGIADVLGDGLPGAVVAAVDDPLPQLCL